MGDPSGEGQHAGRIRLTFIDHRGRVEKALSLGLRGG
jgi:hypothetical protein